MSSKLHDLIASRIRQLGPMDLGEYMGLCLGHPEHGYYMTRDPLGADGDFTTSPEISQMFGELIGAWIADTWDKMGRPDPFALVECGPGRGTLMQDALRATERVTGFHNSIRLYLMEMSPILKAAQAQRLIRYAPIWVSGLDELPTDMPVILIGNEFLDALPIRQLRWDRGWQEIVVGLSDNDTLCFAQKPSGESLLAHVPSHILNQKSAEVFEVSPIINHYLKNLSNILKIKKGAVLFIDYGHAQTAVGDTFQAVQAHRFESPLENPGECDLTAHVDFENVGRIGREEGVFASPIVTQKQFLETLGIGIRAQALKARASAEQAAAIDAALHRLTHPDQMGTLFKVIALCHDDKIGLAGFS